MVKKKQEGPHGIPEFIDILSIDDKLAFEKLQENVGSTKYRYNRNHRIVTLKGIFEQIRKYCQGRKEDQWKRYLVCGICWFGNYIAINTRQLRFLISKSKSTINDALLKMGYYTVSMKGEPVSLLLEKIPFLFGNHNEFRKWSIRRIKMSTTDIDNNIIDIKLENTNIIDDENNCADEINCIDEFFKTNNDLNLNEKEADDKFKFINFDDNVDENFDFGFGFYQNSYEKNSELVNNININFIFEVI